MMEHIGTIIPRALRALEVTPGMFQSQEHYVAWIHGTPMLTERPRRWRVPKRWADIMWRHFGRKCVHCGSVEHLTIGHIIPVEFGGSNQPSNIQPECLTCNVKQWTPECAALAARLKEQAA